MPKRALTGYFVFASEKRDSVAGELRAASENASVPAVSKQLGQLWRDMPDDQRDVYKAKAAEKQKEQELLEDYENEKHEERLEDGVSAPGISTGAIRRIMTMDDDVKRVSAESVQIMSKCAELFLGYVAGKALDQARIDRRKLIKQTDIESALRIDPKLKRTNALDYIGRQRQRQKRSVDEFDDACTMDVEPQHLATKQAKGNSKSDLMKEGNHSKEITSFFKPQD